MNIFASVLLMQQALVASQANGHKVSHSHQATLAMGAWQWGLFAILSATLIALVVLTCKNCRR